MRAMRLAGQVICLLAFINVLAVGQTVDKQSFAKDGLSFDYPAGWTLQDDAHTVERRPRVGVGHLYVDDA